MIFVYRRDILAIGIIYVLFVRRGPSVSICSSGFSCSQREVPFRQASYSSLFSEMQKVSTLRKKTKWQANFNYIVFLLKIIDVIWLVVTSELICCLCRRNNQFRGLKLSSVHSWCWSEG